MAILKGARLTAEGDLQGAVGPHLAGAQESVRADRADRLRGGRRGVRGRGRRGDASMTTCRRPHARAAQHGHSGARSAAAEGPGLRSRGGQGAAAPGARVVTTPTPRSIAAPRDPYAGINAASMALASGDAEEARRLAKEIARPLSNSSGRYWDAATLRGGAAHRRRPRGRHGGAEARRRRPDATDSSRASTALQFRRLAPLLKLDIRETSEVLGIKSVALITGHLFRAGEMDAASQAAAGKAVRAQAEAILAEHERRASSTARSPAAPTSSSPRRRSISALPSTRCCRSRWRASASFRSYRRSDGLVGTGRSVSTACSAAPPRSTSSTTSCRSTAISTATSSMASAHRRAPRCCAPGRCRRNAG